MNQREQAFLNITCDMLELYKKKNHDYGNSFSENFQKFGLVSSVIRLSDKCNRLISLYNKDAQVNDESIDDTLIDLANYAIMTLIERGYGNKTITE